MINVERVFGFIYEKGFKVSIQNECRGMVLFFLLRQVGGSGLQQEELQVGRLEKLGDLGYV